ncbi:hypothetical protein ACFVYA_43600 [Amycolatopsis sp. NPDC058278]|uniref:hypothetical protein n=1 Tax=Amycolatopsis sp. NPDC058278 TaxID=3346417 RepID=UPI0036DA2794
MTKWPRWFDLDWNSDELRPDEQAFLAALQQASAQWDFENTASWAARDEYEHPCLIAVVTLSDPVKNVMRAEFGVHYRDGRAQGDLLHSCLHELPDEPTPSGLDVTGSPEEVAAACAAWFEKTLRRPFVYQEWQREPLGRRHAETRKPAGNGKAPVRFAESAATPRRRLFREGFVFGRFRFRGNEDPPSRERRVR